MLLQWGNDSRILVFSFVLTVGLVALNVWLCIRMWRLRKEEPKGEIVMDWSQNLDEIEIDFPLPDGATSKDVICRITSSTIHFSFREDTIPMLEVSIKRACIRHGHPKR